jgi:hypothetical protein
MKFFKPEDFSDYGNQWAVEIAALANAKLKQEATVVYGGKGLGQLHFHDFKSYSATQKGLLICIQPTECFHPKDKIVQCVADNNNADHFECSCGARVVPETFKELQIND